MKALVFDGEAARVVDHPEPTADSQTALVKVRMAGVCRTDLELVKGYMGFRGVLGHEMVGWVVDGPPQWLAARVVAEINFACGACALCQRGLGRHCPTRRVMGILGADGAFAELVAVPVANLHRVPDSVPDELAVFTEPLAAAFEILDQVHVEPGTDCVVLGDGKLGLLIAQVLDGAGARVVAVGKHERKLAILRELGIQAVRSDQWKPEPADLVVEATGSPRGFAAAMQVVRPRGTLVLKSTTALGADVNLAPLVINEINVVGSRCGRFPPALRALARGDVQVRPLITARFPLSRADQALLAAGQPGALKILIEA
ncbi:MAG: alcohol dehydrogenase [Candidatus Binatia bacterium]|nr:MAG: alcohol dehydrogenase [Candidatus Binatia bacterium]